MGLRGRFSIPEAWLLLVVGMCILAAVAADVGYVIVRRHRTSSARAANAQYPLPEVTGVLRLHDPMYGVSSVATVGGPCKGLGGYHDFIGGTPVSVKDRTGAVIATGALNHLNDYVGHRPIAILLASGLKAQKSIWEIAFAAVQPCR